MMNMYNMLFGRNSQSSLLLAVLGLKECDIERFRDVYVDEDGAKLVVHTRTGGGNRADYPNLEMRKKPGWLGSSDDDYDSTYCNDTFSVPTEFVNDVKALSDVFSNGLRKEFAQHLGITLNRTPTEADIAAESYDRESNAITRLNGVKANGHTFVPYDDYAMESALKLAEANGGKLRSCWGILPLKLSAQLSVYEERKPMREPAYKHCVRAQIKYTWETDEDYLVHCVTRWSALYPKSVEAMVSSAKNYSKKATP